MSLLFTLSYIKSYGLLDTTKDEETRSEYINEYSFFNTQNALNIFRMKMHIYFLYVTKALHLFNKFLGCSYINSNHYLFFNGLILVYEMHNLQLTLVKKSYKFTNKFVRVCYYNKDIWHML